VGFGEEELKNFSTVSFFERFAVGKTVLETFTIFPFSIVLALALGEALKQCVTEREGTQGFEVGDIRWDRVLALVTFLSLILPFYQGMNRYLLHTYGGAASQNISAGFLIIDGIAFMAESALFFVMSRNLSENRWRYFYQTVLALLLVDSGWGFSAIQHANDQGVSTIWKWIALNVVTSILLFVMIKYGKQFLDQHRIAILGACGMIARTVVDYFISWDFYFS